MADSKHLHVSPRSSDSGFFYSMDSHTARRQFQMSMCVVLLIAATMATAGVLLPLGSIPGAGKAASAHSIVLADPWLARERT